MNYNSLTDEALLRAVDIHRPNGPLPFSRAMWFKLVRAGEAPQPAFRSHRCTAWRWGDVRAYLRQLAGEEA